MSFAKVFSVKQLRTCYFLKVKVKVKVKAYLFHNHNKLDGVPISQRHMIIIKIYSDSNVQKIFLAQKKPLE
jgi:hypothetical protein